MAGVSLRPIQPIDGCSCSVCQKPDAIEVLSFEGNNLRTDIRLCAECKRLTTDALTGYTSKDPCICQGFYKPPNCPVHGRDRHRR